MDKYINHLINDIKEIIKKKEATAPIVWDKPNIREKEKAENMEHVDEYMYGEKHELQHIVGLDKDALPPPERLSDDQVLKLLAVLDMLLEVHHLQAAYPGTINNRTKYELLYNNWKSKYVKLNFGNVGIEFCYYNIDECPIPEKCNYCNEVEQEIENKHINSEIISNQIPEEHTESKEEIKQRKAQKVKDTIENMEPNENNIPGIFNFCNRWCDRCKFTDRCTNFQFEKELGIDPENSSMEDALKDVSAILSGTLSMIVDKAKEFGVDVSENDKIEKREVNPARKYPLAKQAENYMIKANNWLKENEDYFSEVAAKIFNWSQKYFRDLNYQLETIGWHMTMIPVKIVRALNPKNDIFDDDDEFYEYNKNATGKLILECINESIEAFNFLYPRLSKKQDEILSFLSTLSQLKSGIEKELPKAKDFIRPGLDEIST